jgi:hypothetical protein
VKLLQKDASEKPKLNSLSSDKSEGVIPKFKYLKSTLLELEPSAEEISSRYQKNEKFIKNFTVKNQYGQVTWEENVDLTDVRIDEVVHISNCCAELYEDKKYMPPIGEKLNKDSKVTLFGVKISYNKKQKEHLKEYKGKEKWDFHDNIVKAHQKKFKNKVEEGGGIFINYNFEKRELCFIHKAKSKD